MTNGSLPVIDLDELRSGHGGNAVVAIRRAITDAGFFYVVNHGVSQGLIAAAVEASRTFFSLPEEDKERVHVDSRHRGYLGFGGSRMFRRYLRGPEGELRLWRRACLPRTAALVPCSSGLTNGRRRSPGSQDRVYDYFLAAIGVGKVVLSGAALALGLRSDFFEPHLVDPLAHGSLIHYPPKPLSERSPSRSGLGVGAHTDYGLITVLWQDRRGRARGAARRPVVARGPLAGRAGHQLRRSSSSLEQRPAGVYEPPGG